MSYDNKVKTLDVVNDVVNQGRASGIILSLQERCQYIQKYQRLTGQFAETIASKDLGAFNRLLQVAQKEGWRSVHTLAYELGSKYDTVLGREVLFPGSLPVSLAISCPQW